MFYDLQLSESGPDRVTLHDVQKELAGKYRCEVTTDAPDFHTQVVSAQVQVVGRIQTWILLKTYYLFSQK